MSTSGADTPGPLPDLGFREAVAYWLENFNTHWEELNNHEVSPARLRQVEAAAGAGARVYRSARRACCAQCSRTKRLPVHAPLHARRPTT